MKQKLREYLLNRRVSKKNIQVSAEEVDKFIS